MKKIILIDEKSDESILVYEILCKTLIGAKPLRIRFNKVDGTRYLALFGSEKYDFIYYSIRYLIKVKNRY